MKDRLPHLKAIVQYMKTISEREEGIELMEVRGGRWKREEEKEGDLQGICVLQR